MEEEKKKNKYIIFFFGDCNVAIKWKTHTEKEIFLDIAMLLLNGKLIQRKKCSLHVLIICLQN